MRSFKGVRKPLKGEWCLDVTNCQYIRVLEGNKRGSNNAIDDNGSRWSERGECSKSSDILDSRAWVWCIRVYPMMLQTCIAQEYDQKGDAQPILRKPGRIR
jgi:hypothetical protein